MKNFELPARTRLSLLKTTPRKEAHGDDHVQAISLRVRLEAGNEVLLLLHPALQDMIFWRGPELEAQKQVDGLLAVKPNLRCPMVEGPWKLDFDVTGYTITLDHGLGAEAGSNLELRDCTLSKFTVNGKEGGTAIVEWSVASNKEITPELVGALCSLEGDEITVHQKAPAIDSRADDAESKALAKQKGQEAAGQQRIDTPEKALVRAINGNGARA